MKLAGFFCRGRATLSGLFWANNAASAQYRFPFGERTGNKLRAVCRRCPRDAELPASLPRPPGRFPTRGCPRPPARLRRPLPRRSRTGPRAGVTAPPARGGSGSAGSDALPILPALPRDPSSLWRCHPSPRSPPRRCRGRGRRRSLLRGAGGRKGPLQSGASRSAAGPSSADPPSAGGSTVRPEPSAGRPAVNPEPSAGGPVLLLPPRPRPEL